MKVEVPDWIIELNQYGLIIFFVMVVVGAILVFLSLRMRYPECGFHVFAVGLLSLVLSGVGLVIHNL